MSGYTIGSYKLPELPDSTDDRIKQLEAENARLRQQVKSLVEAWKEDEKQRQKFFAGENLDVYLTAKEKLRDAFQAVQSAQETEEK